MKPQIIISASLLVLSLFLSGNNSIAANKEQKQVKTEKTDFKAKPLNSVQSEKDHSSVPAEKNNPSKQKNKESHKDSVPFSESNKKVHSEEDGKHHHFHTHRIKRVKRNVNLVNFLTKLLLVITHICLLVSVLQAGIAH
jgi:flagellum-specific peptidoglycan hydrolase FlgJ